MEELATEPKLHEIQTMGKVVNLVEARMQLKEDEVETSWQTWLLEDVR